MSLNLRHRVYAGALATTLALAATPAFSCDCYLLGETFWDTVSRHNAKVDGGEWPKDHALTIVTGTVTEHRDGLGGGYPTEMSIEVDGVLQGQATAATLRVEGDDGHLCRPYVTRFPVGTRWVMALNRLKPDSRDYYVSVCGIYAQKVDKP